MPEQPSGDLRGEAVTLWRLVREKEELRCFLVEPPRGFWLGIERGHDLVLSETYPSLEAALARAEALKAPLTDAGWAEGDADVPRRRAGNDRA
jgi:hypothetical protein